MSSDYVLRIERGLRIRTEARVGCPTNPAQHASPAIWSANAKSSVQRSHAPHKSGLFAAPCHSVSRDERHVIDRYRQQPLKFDGVGHDPKGDIGLNGSSGCVSLHSVSRHDSSNQYCANGTGSSVSKVSMRRLRTCEQKSCARDQSLDSATLLVST